MLAMEWYQWMAVVLLPVAIVVLVIVRKKQQSE